MISNQSTAAAPVLARTPQPKMVSCLCAWCKAPFEARAADRKRGWGKFCSKSCKALKQEKRTGQYRDRSISVGTSLAAVEDAAHQQAMQDSTAGWDEGGWRDDDSGCE